MSSAPSDGARLRIDASHPVHVLAEPARIAPGLLDRVDLERDRLAFLHQREGLFVFSGVIRFSMPRWSSLPQRPQFDSSFSHCFSLSSVTSRPGSCVDGWA